MEENAELLGAAYAAFNRHDADGVLRWMHKDVDWPNAADGSRVHGHQAVRAYWQGQWEHFHPQVDPVRIVQGGDGKIVVEVHQVVTDLEGRVLADRMVDHVYEIRDGLIVRMEIREPAEG